MNHRRTLVITRRALVQFRHDRRTLGFVLGMPLLMMLIFGYTFGGEVKHVSLIVVNHDVVSPINGTLPLSENVIQNLDGVDTFDIQQMSELNAARQKVKDGEAWGVVYFPTNMTPWLLQSLMSNQNLPVVANLFLDGTNPNVESAIRLGLQRATLDAINERREFAGLEPIQLEGLVTTTYIYGSEDLEFIDYFAPGVMGFAIMMIGSMLTILIFVQERTGGTLERLLTSPATEAEVVAGYALAFAVLGLIQSVVILTAALLIFGIHIEGSLLLMLLVVVILAVGHQGLGILLSAAARNELQAIQFVPLILFPSILLSGLFWPVESIPGFLQPLARVVPLTHGIEALRSVALRGWGLGRILPELAFLCGFALLTLGGSVAQLRRRD